MKTLCTCGFDCTEFVSQHAIPGTAQFACPVCEVDLHAVADSPAAVAGNSLRAPGVGWSLQPAVG
jgi:hypothetical protein